RKWPTVHTKLWRYCRRAGGSAVETMPAEPAASSSFGLDPDAGQRGVLAPGGDPWDKLPAYDWRPPADGKAAVFETAPLDHDVLMLGSASADLFVKSTADDADLQATLSEVRPDGQEMFVQSGWLRASYRA